MNAVLKKEQDQRINTGANRKTTWTASAPGGRSTEQILSLVGNSANAELAAGQWAMNVSEISSYALNEMLSFFFFERLSIGVLVLFLSIAATQRRAGWHYNRAETAPFYSVSG